MVCSRELWGRCARRSRGATKLVRRHQNDAGNPARDIRERFAALPQSPGMS